MYWGLTPQQQPGSYRGGHDDDEMSVSLVEETGVPGGNHRRGGGGSKHFLYIIRTPVPRLKIYRILFSGRRSVILY